MKPLVTLLVAATSAVVLAPTPNRTLLLNPDAPEFTGPAPAQCVVRLETTHGTIDIEVTRDWAPRGGGLKLIARSVSASAPPEAEGCVDDSIGHLQRSRRFTTFPVGPIGSASRISTVRGYL